MAKIKRPQLARFKLVGVTDKHQFPFHVVGEFEGRFVTVAMTHEEAFKVYQTFEPHFNKIMETNNETDSVQQPHLS